MDHNCKNFDVCGKTTDTRLDLCGPCYWMFHEVLTFGTSVDCPVCLDITGPSVKYQSCDHFVCINCFKRMKYGDEDSENEPKFPYSSEIEDEYWDDQDGFIQNPRWELDPNIIRWREECNAWEDACQPPANLQNCPLCRGNNPTFVQKVQQNPDAHSNVYCYSRD